MEIFAVSIFSLVSASTLGQAQLQPQTPRGRGQPEIAKFNKFNHQTKYIRIDANAIQVVILARSDASQQPPPRSWPLAGWGPHGHPGGGGGGGIPNGWPAWFQASGVEGAAPAVQQRPAAGVPGNLGGLACPPKVHGGPQVSISNVQRTVGTAH